MKRLAVSLALAVVAAATTVTTTSVGAAEESRTIAFRVTVNWDSHDTHPGDGLCLDAQRKCSLRATIDEVNAGANKRASIVLYHPGPFTITQSGAHEDLNASGDFDVTLPGGEVSILSKYRGAVISGNNLDRVFHVAPTTKLNLQRVSIRDGKALTIGGGSWGGGILVRGSLSLTDVSVEQNSANHGGGVASQFGGEISITNSTIERNSAAIGGGLRLVSGNGPGEATATFTNVAIRNNLATVDLSAGPFFGEHGGSGGGGYISQYGIDANELTVDGNTADSISPGPTLATGGGLTLGMDCSAEQHEMTFRNSSIVNNTSLDAIFSDAGGIWAFFGGCAVLTFEKSAFINNEAGQGAGLMTHGRGDLRITDSVFSENHGQDFQDTGFGSSLSLLQEGRAVIERSSFVRNDDFWGGTLNFGQDVTAVVRNSTIALNTGKGDVPHGITFQGSDVSLEHVSLYNNFRGNIHAMPHPWDGSGWDFKGRGVLSVQHGRTGGPSCNTEPGPFVQSIITDKSCGTAVTAMPSVELVDSGVAVGSASAQHTMEAIRPLNSSAIDAVDCFLGTDQLGQSRPLGARCDAGSIEAA